MAPRITDRQRELIKALHCSGYRVCDITRIVGASRQAVYFWIGTIKECDKLEIRQKYQKTLQEITADHGASSENELDDATLDTNEIQSDSDIGDNDASVEPESANEDIQEFHSESTQGKHTLGKSDKSAEVPKQSSKKSTSGDTATHTLRTKSAKKDKDAIEPASSTASIEDYEKFGEAIASTLNAMPDQAASRLQADLQRVLELYEEEKTCCKSTSKKERKNLPIYPILKITKITPESTECQAVNNRSKRKFFTTEETEKCSKRKTNSNEMVENVNEDGNQGFHVANCKLKVNLDYPHFLDIDKEPSKDPLTFEVKEENV